MEPRIITKEVYMKPEVEVIEMMLEAKILTGSGDSEPEQGVFINDYQRGWNEW